MVTYMHKTQALPEFWPLFWPAWPHPQQTRGPQCGCIIAVILVSSISDDCGDTAWISSLNLAAHRGSHNRAPSPLTPLHRTSSHNLSFQVGYEDFPVGSECTALFGVIGLINWSLASSLCTPGGMWPDAHLERVSMSLANTQSSSPGCLHLSHSSEHCAKRLCRDRKNSVGS